MLATFRVVMRYEDPNRTAYSLIQAENLEEARLICEEMFRDYEKMMIGIKSKNIFVSSRVVEFSAEPESENQV